MGGSSRSGQAGAGANMRTRGSTVGDRQAPLRTLYAERPQAALTRKSARTTSAEIAATDPFHGEVEVGSGYGTSLRFGLDRHVGGLHDAPNPADLLCAALAACQDGAIRMIANLLGVELAELEVEVTGEVDARGCLGADRDVRVGFEALECRVSLRAKQGTHPKRVKTVIAAAERFCVNLDTLRGGVEVANTADPAQTTSAPSGDESRLRRGRDAWAVPTTWSDGTTSGSGT